MFKNKSQKKGLDKAAIIAEYLTQGNTYKFLGEKYGIPHETIKGWVRAHRLKAVPVKGEEPQSQREKDLGTELHNLQLKNQLLEEILSLSEQETGIDFKKKYGTRQ
jgi:transposase-like protein